MVPSTGAREVQNKNHYKKRHGSTHVYTVFILFMTVLPVFILLSARHTSSLDISLYFFV